MNKLIVQTGLKGWVIRRPGAKRASKRFPSKREAVAAASRRLRKSGGEVYVHAKDGTVEKVLSINPKP